MDMNDKEHQKRDQEVTNREIGKLENNKQPGSKGEQHTVRNKLKEDLYITQHKVRLLQVSERERLAKLKENTKLIKLKEEINGINEEILEEDESDVKNINNLIQTATTIMKQKINQPSKRNKN